MRKWIALLLAVLMMALPVCSLAATPDELMTQASEAGLTLETRLSFTPGNLPFGDEINPYVSDMLSALALRWVGGPTQRSAALEMSGSDVLTFAIENAEDRLYLASNLLGGTVSFNDAELVAFTEKMITIMGEAAQMTEEQIDEMRAAMSGMTTTTAVTNAAGMFTEDDFKPVVDYITAIAARAETTDVTVQPKDCDAAAKQVTFTLTAEDVAGLYDVIFEVLKGNAAFMAQLDQMGPITVENESLTAQEAMEKLPAKLHEQIVKMMQDTPVTMLLDENGKLVRAEMDMVLRTEVTVVTNAADTAATGTAGFTADTAPAIDTKTGTTTEDVAVTTVYTRQTTSGGVGHAIDMQVTDENGLTVAVTAAWLDESDTQAVFSLNVTGKQEGKDDVDLLSVLVNGTKQYTDSTATRSVTAALSVRPDETSTPLQLTVNVDTDAAFDGKSASCTTTTALYLTGETTPVVTITKETKSVEAPASIATADAQTPGAMDDTAFQTWLNGVVSSAYTGLIGVMQSLPSSVLTMMMGTTAQ